MRLVSSSAREATRLPALHRCHGLWRDARGTNCSSMNEGRKWLRGALPFPKEWCPPALGGIEGTLGEGKEGLLGLSFLESEHRSPASQSVMMW